MAAARPRVLKGLRPPLRNTTHRSSVWSWPSRGRPAVSVVWRSTGPMGGAWGENWLQVWPQKSSSALQGGGVPAVESVHHAVVRAHQDDAGPRLVVLPVLLVGVDGPVAHRVRGGVRLRRRGGLLGEGAVAEEGGDALRAEARVAEELI